MSEPTIPTMIAVGALRFRKGCKVETVQGAIDRVVDRYQRYDRIVWKLLKFKERLPPDVQADLITLYGASPPPQG